MTETTAPTTEDLIVALTIARIFIKTGKPMTRDEQIAAGKALGIVRGMEGKEKVALKEAIEARVKLCIAA